jgi:hypothetical protein
VGIERCAVVQVQVAAGSSTELLSVRGSMKWTPIFCGLILVLLSWLAVASFGDERETGTLCLAPLRNAPIAIYPPSGRSPFCLITGKAKVKIDNRQSLDWPNDKELKIAGLDLAGPHRIVIVCDGKPVQTFRFRFSQKDNKRVCLLINDFYGWAQFFEPKGALGCPCK